MELKDCIEQVLSRFEKGDIFDSHTVIQEIRNDKNMNEVYMHCFPERFTIEQYHSFLSQEIGKRDDVKKLDFKIKTHTIYGKIEPNQAWEKK